MCNLSKGIIERSEKKGRSEERIEQQIIGLRTVMRKMDCSLTEAMDFMDTPESDRAAIIAKMGQ